MATGDVVEWEGKRLDMEEGSVVEWRIENLRHWCKEVHGNCIQSPEFLYPYFSNMILYPKGINVNDEHLAVRLCGVDRSFFCELSFHSSDGSLLCTQQLHVMWKRDVLDLPPGPKFQDVLSRIREDFITVTLRVDGFSNFQVRMCTTINALKVSLEIISSWIKEVRPPLTLDKDKCWRAKKGHEDKNICSFHFRPRDLYDGIDLYICSENKTVFFLIQPPSRYEYPFAVEMCMRWKRSFYGTAVNCVKKEHVFRDNSPWTFPDPLEEKELEWKNISLTLCWKTQNLIQSPLCTNWDCSFASIEINNTFPISDNKASKDPVKKVTKDSAMPDDSVQALSKELMGLYKDQESSDVTLKCDNVSFHVHKAILSARSPVFKALLSTDMAASSEVVIGDLDPSTLSIFLTYVYTGAGVEEQLKGESALKLYYAAEKYQVLSLKRECSKFLCYNMSISNVCDILSLADRHRDGELTAASHGFILDNFKAVLKSKEWDALKKNKPFLVSEILTQFGVEGSVARKDKPY